MLLKSADDKTKRLALLEDLQQSPHPTLNAMEVIANGLGLSIFELWEKIRAA